MQVDAMQEKFRQGKAMQGKDKAVAKAKQVKDKEFAR